MKNRPFKNRPFKYYYGFTNNGWPQLYRLSRKGGVERVAIRGEWVPANRSPLDLRKDLPASTYDLKRAKNWLKRARKWVTTNFGVTPFPAMTLEIPAE